MEKTSSATTTNETFEVFIPVLLLVVGLDGAVNAAHFPRRK
jgi:hypothetical protein